MEAIMDNPLGVGLAVGSAGVLGLLWWFGDKEYKALEQAAAEGKSSGEEIEVYKNVKHTFGYVAGGLLTTSLAGCAFWKLMESGVDPQAICGGGCIIALVSLVSTFFIPKQQVVNRHAAWLAFNAGMGASLAPIGALPGSVVSQALLTTGGAVAGLSAVALTSPLNGKWLFLGGPLCIGLGMLNAVSWMAHITGNASVDVASSVLGAGVFGLFLIFDLQKTFSKARQQRGQFDPLIASYDIYLDILNLFLEVLKLYLASQQDKKNKK